MVGEQNIKYSKAYIFGAHSRGKTLKGYLQFLYPEVEIISFIVDDTDENDMIIEGIPVHSMREMDCWDKSAIVYIATKGLYHADIKKRLESIGMQHILPITVEIDNFFRNQYVKEYMESKRCSFVKIDDLSVHNKLKGCVNLKGTIYMAKSIFDKTMQSVYVAPIYERAIQVGAILAGERLNSNILTDCEGENISAKNRQYCELTAIYWIWKHVKDDMIGLSHYRRHFILPDNWLELVTENKVDVVLPVPTYVLPNIEENYKERHGSYEWDYLLIYLKDRCPEDYKIAKALFAENLYSPCNMFIMRREILNEMCTWMFPILDAVAEYCGTKDDVYLNRYPGFISERLITLFFYKNRARFNIVYADKNFIT